MCKDGESTGESTGGKVDKRKSLPQLFTPMTARQAQEASVKARNLRKQVRAQMLNKVVQNYDFAEEMIKALKKGDLDKVTLLKEAMALIGLKYEQSEEFVNRMHIDATTDNKTALSGQIEFVIPPKN